MRNKRQIKDWMRLQRKDPIRPGYSLASVEEILHMRSMPKEGTADKIRGVIFTLEMDTFRLRNGWMQCSPSTTIPEPVAGFLPHTKYKLIVKREIGRLSERIEEGIGDRGSWIREFLYDCEEGSVSQEEFRKVVLLLQNPVDEESGWTVLHSVAVFNAVDFMRNTVLPELQKSGILAETVNAKTKPDVAIDFSYGPKSMLQLSPLHVAAIYSEEDLVCQLLDHGADPNILDGSGMSPFTLGLQQLSLDVFGSKLALLLVRTNVRDHHVRSQLKHALKDIALKKCNVNSVAHLLKCFDRHDKIDMYGLLHEAIKCRNKKILETVLGALSRLERRSISKLSCLTDGSGLTLLHQAVMLTRKRGQQVGSVIDNCIQPLLEYYSDHDGKERIMEVYDLFWKGVDDHNLKIAYAYAREEKVQKVLVHDWLCKCEAYFMDGADDPRQQTSLQWAARLRMTRLCQQLLQGTADLLLDWDKAKDRNMSDVVEEMLGQLERPEWKATLNYSEMVNVLDVLKSHRLGLISQDKDELEQHVTQATDQPTCDDILGRKPLVDALAALILNPYVSAPLTIGIYGDWGIGKSSIMLQMEIRLLQIVIEQAVSKSDSHVRIRNFLGMILQAPNSSEDFLKQFISKYKKRYHSLLKTLALLDISKLVDNAGGQQRHTPPILTVRYNAWQYQDEKEALAGLANEISKEIEAAMTTPQWLSMCWCNSMNDRHHGRPPILFLCSILLTLVSAILITWLLWVLLSSSSNFALQTLKYGSVPVAVLLVFWSALQQLYGLIVPVSKSINKMFSPVQHNANLGYHQQVIDDIRFLMEELCRTPSPIWNFFAWIWTNIFRQWNRDYVVVRLESSQVKSNGVRGYRWICSIILPWLVANNISIRVPKQIPSENLRVVVFVDDLDRCNQDTILQVLSSINLVLSVCEFNVVLGVEKSMIIRTIKKKLFSEEDPDEGSNLAERFLEKIVQLPVVLPDPGRQKVNEFLTRQMGFWLKKATKPSSSNPKFIGIKVRTDDSDSDDLDETEHNIEDDGIASDALFATYTADECVVFMELQKKYATDELRHPREWKRLLNYHRLAYNVVSQNKMDQAIHEWKKKLIVWVFFCWNWKELMNEIIKDWEYICQQFENKQPSLLEIVELKINTQGASTTHIEKWTRMLKILQKYDISMKGIQMFQDFRFQCQQGYLQLLPIDVND